MPSGDFLKIPICPNCNIRGVACYSHPNGTSKAEGYFCPSCHKFLQGPPIKHDGSQIFNGDVRDFLRAYTGPKFDLILVDPPWKYGIDLMPRSRKTENHYDTMSIDEIAHLPIQNVVGKSAILFEWTTSALLHNRGKPDAFTLMDEWGFDYRYEFIWAKKKDDRLQIGMGWNDRVVHEILLVGKKGNYPIPPPTDRLTSIFEAPSTRKHSEKPEKSYQIIERMYPGARKIEFFARKPRKGWYTVGNQIESMHESEEKTIEMCIRESE